MKFTFKKWARPTGLAQVGWLDGADIKLKGKVCGWYERMRTDNGYRYVIFFHKADERQVFKNIRLKRNFNNEDECREYLR